MRSRCIITTEGIKRDRSLPQDALKPHKSSRFVPNPPRAPTEITPRSGISLPDSSPPHVPRSSN
ncbi:hypothetical protein Taro_036743 [Colocasia esculenta]|uniref:Uncharacterized protein n=1 Tax=Colocasia esculenta TaxID=4460 RepID=A0A843VYE8_COLES|nr:hypothetical protein [Colocasia esculenta]